MRSYLLFIAVCVCALAAALVPKGQSAPPDDPAPPTTTAAPEDEQPDLLERRLKRIIHAYRRKVWHWQRVMGRPMTLTLKHPPLELVDRARVWQSVAKHTWTRAQNPPHAAAWRCIHRYEGAWADTGGPYYGGLQMDLGFQRRYGAYLLRKKGTANRWTPLEQMWVAERALRSGRGFYPWPNTARACGLL